MHFDHAALKNIITKLLQHLGLCGMHHIPEIHMRTHLALEGYLHRFRDWHGGFPCGQCQCHCAGVSPEGDAF